MNELWIKSLFLRPVQVFGPAVQFFFTYGVLALAAAAMGGAAFLGQRQLLRRKSRLWVAPFPVLLAGLIYGILRLLGCLLYAADGWDTGGPWNYTWQNRGALVLFVCGSLLLGAVLAVWKERRTPKK